MNIIDRILDLMNKNNINATKLSKEISLTNGLISQWKQGKQKPSLEALNKIAKYFNVSIDYLVNGENYYQQEDIKINIKEPEIIMLFKIYSSLNEKKQHIVLQKALELANEE